MTLTNKTRALADVHAGEIIATVEIAAPIEQIFEALTNTEILPKWWGHPDVYTTQSMTADLRPGGAWRCDGMGADGHAFHVRGTYSVIDRPHLLEFTWLPSWEGETETKVSYALEQIEAGTRVILRHRGFGAQAASCKDHASGWEMVLSWLQQFAAPSPAFTTYFVRLLPPRPSFAQDATPDELEIMQHHGRYWRERMAEGKVVVFGPVGDPHGGWGLGVIRVRSEQELVEFQRADPAILSGLRFRYEALPMIQAITP